MRKKPFRMFQKLIDFYYKIFYASLVPTLDWHLLKQRQSNRLVIWMIKYFNMRSIEVLNVDFCVPKAFFFLTSTHLNTRFISSGSCHLDHIRFTNASVYLLIFLNPILITVSRWLPTTFANSLIYAHEMKFRWKMENQSIIFDERTKNRYGLLFEGKMQIREMKHGTKGKAINTNHLLHHEYRWTFFKVDFMVERKFWLRICSIILLRTNIGRNALKNQQKKSILIFMDFFSSFLLSFLNSDFLS